jgi:hypothetical protein
LSFLTTNTTNNEKISFSRRAHGGFSIDAEAQYIKIIDGACEFSNHQFGSGTQGQNIQGGRADL